MSKPLSLKVLCTDALEPGSDTAKLLDTATGQASKTLERLTKIEVKRVGNVLLLQLPAGADGDRVRASISTMGGPGWTVDVVPDEDTPIVGSVE